MPLLTEGSPARPGAAADAAGLNIAVVAPEATAVHLCLFDRAGREELARHRLPARSGDVWHGHVAGIGPGTRYGLRAEGPWEPATGRRFDAAKLLLDPWARAIDRPFAWHPDLARFGAETAHLVPKAVVVPEVAPPLAPPPRPGPRVIYELHARGFTRLHPEIPEAIRGTVAALGHPAAIAHLRRLGVTHVEIMPLAAGIDERHLAPLGLRNYWNYNPVALLVPCPRLAPGGMAEIRAAVDALRAAGIGVILDLVLNHTGESDAAGPALSLRGLADAAFHRLLPGGAYANDTGCGNSLALDRPWALRLAMDALRHWVAETGAEGIRLDLGTTLGRRDSGFDAAAPLLSAMRQDPLLRERLVIAEPWDIGPGGYRLGEFPAGWGEWNDRFRDTVRSFWRGDPGMAGELATRLAGSADLFRPPRRVADSVNFVAAHDGFTLADLVSYEHRHNEANGENGRDGHAGNHSWNHGVEGPSDDPVIRAKRAADVRALLATLLAARGTPMLGMGDEAGRSQGGNNNAYAQDNEVSWLDWARLDAGLCDFAARLVRARLTHPALTATAPLTGRPADDGGIPDVAWRQLDGRSKQEEDWGRARAVVAVFYAAGDRVAVALHGGEAPAELVLPPPRPGHGWRLLADSADPARQGKVGERLPVSPRSVLLVAEEGMGGHQDMDPALLGELAEAAGIAPEWHGLDGSAHRVPEGTLRAILGALGLPAESAAQARESLERLKAPCALPAAASFRLGEAATLPCAAEGWLTLVREDGETQPLQAEGPWDQAPGRPPCRRLALPALPIGRHRIFPEGQPELGCEITVAPPAGFLPQALAGGGRGFGVAVQLYALRRPGDQGIGDYTALAEAARLAGAEGAMLLGLSPPHALPPLERSRASPYQPSDRRFLEPAFIDLGAIPFGPAAPVLPEGALVDYPAVWAAKRAGLLAAWRDFPEAHPWRAELAGFRAQGGAALERFAAFNAIAAQRGSTDWRRWPAELARGDAEGVAAFIAAHPEEIGFEVFQQFLADRQMGEAAQAGAGLYRDLAVGAAPDGAELWSGDARFLDGLSIGAPPDAFAPEGQVWGIPAPAPTDDAGFAALLRANMRHAAALRIDHVLGLTRLFLVPDGARGGEGAYLRYPLKDRLATLALESHRARCLVVGEDLGTVPPGLRAELAADRVLSYRVLWFEREGEGFVPPARWPALAAACVATHDLPTLLGWWQGEDIAEREALGIGDAVAARAGREAERAALRRLLEAEGLWPEDEAELPAAVHALVARTPSALLLVQAEDLAGELVAVNLPGTDWQRPNWRRRLPLPVAALFADPRARAILDAVRREGRAAG
ncbi:glycogen debranching protein GlgX [Siccirubricoccus sp. KC 17139]|uniref:4-alpha-glucanotransferase n=1 Tax=Siccirubricoccus soli TaxID=2899147 RepID=A0ABT1D496_9PROT|nr:glycogen debranching protein GlgX [Siccirubricoccus soli]MCO6416743.1 glycogen debranching protein GlgX [Siccirubricoccus soli]MCP2682878.1 glycogen debranching protein GlgX [Siccirubricoccus soli]